MSRRNNNIPLDDIVRAVELAPNLQIERVDDWSVYLVDPQTNIRTRRICGCEFPVSGEHGRELKTCRVTAGKGTGHLGTGRCKKHELPPHELKRLYMALALSALEPGQKNPLQPFVQKAAVLMQTIDLASVNHELSALYAILLAKQDALKRELESTNTGVRVRALREIQRDVLSIAKLKLEIRKESNASDSVHKGDLERLFVGFRVAIEENLPVGQRELLTSAVFEMAAEWVTLK